MTTHPTPSSGREHLSMRRADPRPSAGTAVLPAPRPTSRPSAPDRPTRSAPPVRNRWSRLTRLPRASSAVAVAVGVALSVFPSYLPHDPFTQGVVTTLLVSLLLAVVRRFRSATSTLTDSAHQFVLGASGVVTFGALVAHHLIENGMRADIGMSRIGPLYWLCMALSIGIVLLLGHIARMTWRHRRRLWRAGLVLAVMIISFSPISPVQAQPAISVPTASSERPLSHPSPVGAVRVYAAARDGESLHQRAERAADRLVAQGGLRVEHVVIAIPTGSGWVDPDMVEGLEQRFGAQVATVGIQYDDLPSWMSYLLHQNDADTAARALFAAVTQRIDRLPAAERPQLHVYGQSLGATAAQSIFTGPHADRARRQVCSVLWVGTPGGHTVGLAKESSVANPDDPVVHTRPSDLWSPPQDGRPWLPGISYLQAGADLVDALLVPQGSGHNYGPQQAAALQTC